MGKSPAKIIKHPTSLLQQQTKSIISISYTHYQYIGKVEGLRGGKKNGDKNEVHVFTLNFKVL